MMITQLKQIGNLLIISNADGEKKHIVCAENLEIIYNDDIKVVIITGSDIEVYNHRGECVQRLQVGKNGEYVYLSRDL